MNSNDEFLKAIRALPEPKPVIIEYRLHYDDEGHIHTCSMIEPHPSDTQYLVVDKETYGNYYHYRVVDNKLKFIDRNPELRVQLTKGTQGYAVVRDHAGIILEKDESYSNVEHYAAN